MTYKWRNAAGRREPRSLKDVRASGAATSAATGVANVACENLRGSREYAECFDPAGGLPAVHRCQPDPADHGQQPFAVTFGLGDPNSVNLQ
jgi:hypothetical protein